MGRGVGQGRGLDLELEGVDGRFEPVVCGKCYEHLGVQAKDELCRMSSERVVDMLDMTTTWN